MNALLGRLAAAHEINLDGRSPPSDRTFRTSEGLVLHALEWPGAGEPVLFLHGGALTAHSWDLVCLALAGAFHCMALDLRGHGESGWSDDYSIEANVRDVEEVLDQWGRARCHVVGMSLGGNIAAHYAASPRARMASLVMIDVAPGVDFGSIAGMRKFLDTEISHLTLDQLVDLAVSLSARGDRDKVLYRYWHMTRPIEGGGLAWRLDRRRERDYAHILAKLHELTELAPRIGCKTLVVRGGISRVLTSAKAKEFADLFPNGHWAVIVEAGHNVQEDQPKALADTLRAFLA